MKDYTEFVIPTFKHQCNTGPHFKTLQLRQLMDG